MNLSGRVRESGHNPGLPVAGTSRPDRSDLPPVPAARRYTPVLGRPAEFYTTPLGTEEQGMITVLVRGDWDARIRGWVRG
jgi:hypothetical protein